MVFGMRRLLVSALAVALALLVGGCGKNEVVAPVTAGSVHLGNGQTLRIDMGRVNESVGDSWYLVGQPNPDVLVESDQELAADCHQAGCGGELSWLFDTAGKGATSVVFQYCWRTRPPNCQGKLGQAKPDPVTLTVTVT
jgi:predicted secreted protein